MLTLLAISPLDSLRHVVAIQDSLLRLAATRPIRVTAVLPLEPFWKTSLFSALAGAVVGAGIAVIAQLIGSLFLRQRTKRVARQRLLDQLLVTRDHASQARQDLSSFGPAKFLFGGLEHELDVLDATIAQDLAQFDDVLTRTAIRTFRANLGRTIDSAHALTERVEATSQQLYDTPEVQRALAGVAARLASDCRRAGRAVLLLKAADRFGSRPFIRRLRRGLRRLKRRKMGT